jgi:large repetitive protein
MVGGLMAIGGLTRIARTARVGATLVVAFVLLALVGATPALATPMLAIGSPTGGSVTNHSTVTISGTTSYAGSSENPTEVTVHVYEGATASGTPVQSPSAAPSESGAWTVHASSLSDGTYTAVAEQSEMGESGSSPPVTFKVDTTAPGVTMDAVSSPTKQAKPTLTGSIGTEEGDIAAVTVTISQGASVVETGSATVSGTTWSYAVEAELGDGSYTAKASQKDEAGNTGTASRAFTVKRSVPKPTLDSITSPTNNSSPTLQGAAETAEGDLPEVEVTIYKGSSVEGPVQVTQTVPVSSERWSYTPSALPDGTYTAQASQRDEAANSGVSQARTFTIDTVAPKVTVAPIASPTNHTKPTLTGKVGSEPGDIPTVLVTIHEGNSMQGGVVAYGHAKVSGASWTYEPESELSAGTYTAVAEQQDAAHNVGQAQTTFTVKTAKPVVTVSAPEPDSNNATPSFSGTADTGEGNIRSVTVRIYAQGSGVVRTLSASVNGGGAWSTGPVEKLEDGTYSVQAEQRDEAGNSGVSLRPSFRIDTIAPVITMKPVAKATKGPTVTLAGSAGTAPGDLSTVTVTIYNGSAVSEGAIASIGTAHVNTHGEWSFTSGSLAEGIYTVQASQSDEAHNVGHSEPPATFNVISKPPTVVLNPPALRSNNREPTFSGTASAGAKVTVTVDDGTGMKLAQAPATPGTEGTWTTKPIKLPSEKGPSAYSVVATAVDEAGNSTTTPRDYFSVDLEAPALTMATVAPATNNRTPGYSGTTDEATPVTVYIYAAGQTVAESCEKPGAFIAFAAAPATSKVWNVERIGAPLPDGHYLAIATQTSRYGNHCSETAPAPFAVRTVAPQVAITSPPNDSGAVGTSQLVSGTAGTAEFDLPRVTVELFSGEGVSPTSWIQSVPTTATQGRWSVTFAGLAPGTYTVRATQADEAGNVGTSAADVFRLVVAAATVGKPTAAFSWYPSAPHAGEAVTLVSSSADPTSPLTGFAWDLAGNGPFQPGAGVLTTSFASSGIHTVRLRVSDATGAASVATEAIPVSAPTVPVLEPFPLVRIVTTRSGSGLRLSVLSILASRGAHVTITCKGRGCPVRKESKVASAGKVGLASVSFARFQRTLPAGTTLEIRVYAPGKIGKYTSLSVRRGGILRRIDKCLEPNDVTPMTCPVG